MKHGLKKPCNDCPYRRKATPGWLGNGTPDWFVSAALADYYEQDAGHGCAAPCHKTVDYSNPDWPATLEDAEVCVGALVFYRNVDPFKLPRDRDRSDLIAATSVDHDLVFSTAQEFLDHHNSDRSMRSWLYGEGGQNG